MTTIALDKDTLAYFEQRDAKLSEKVQADIVQIWEDYDKKHAEKKDKPAVIEQEQLAGLTKIEIAGIPVGQALVGGSVALLVSELVDGIIGGAVKDKLGATWGPAIVKGGSAWAVKSWLPGVIGAKAADTAALFLAWEAISSLIPIDTWISGLFKKKEEATTSSSASHSSESPSGGNGHQGDAMDMLRLSLAGGR